MLGSSKRNKLQEALESSKNVTNGQVPGPSPAQNNETKVPPGMRFFSTPGDSYESAAYALSIGCVTNPRTTRPLKWSNMSPERVCCDSFKPVFNGVLLTQLGTKAMSIDTQRPLEPAMLSKVVAKLNSDNTNKFEVYLVQEDGTTQLLMPQKIQGSPKLVFIRLHNDRWEGCGYFQDSVSSVSSSQTSNTFSAISKIDIEPINPFIEIGSPLNAWILETDYIADMMNKTHIDTTIGPILSSSKNLMTLVQKTHCWSEANGLPSNLENRLFLDFVRFGRTVTEVSKAACRNATDAESKAFSSKWQEYVNHEVDRYFKLLKNHETVVQRVDGNSGEEEDRNSEAEEDEESGENEEEESEEESEEEKSEKVESDEEEDQEAEQRNREMAQALATQYAEQDRYDSCSDSD